jgi:heat shock protein HslJ
VAAGVKPHLALLSLAGCAAMQAPAGESYGALGTEPFWSITMVDGRIDYETPDGPNFSVPAPAAQTIFNGLSYAADRIILTITHAQCSDGMSDNIYPDTVVAMVDGHSLRGCGGETLPPGTLANSHWQIQEIDGEPVFERGYFLEFGPDRINGLAGCNRFSGPYRRQGDSLAAGPLAATRMACAGPGMGHEQRVLALLRGPLAISHSDDGDTLRLTGEGGGTIRLQQVLN